MMGRKSSFTGLLVTALCGLVCSLYRKDIYVAEAKTWYEAQRYCREKHTDLSYVNTAKNADRLDTISGYISGVNAWIGLHKDIAEGSKWKWSGGRGRLPLAITWATFVPTYSGGDYNCVALWNNVAFNYKCDTKFSFFCYESDLVLVKENRTWEEALEYCRDQYKDLPSLLSEAEQSSAKKTTSEAQTSQVWTGLRFLAGQWLWVNGDGLEYQDWPAGEMPFCPARYLHCGTLDKEEEHWGTRDCKEKLNFLCVKKWSD